MTHSWAVPGSWAATAEARDAGIAFVRQLEGETLSGVRVETLEAEGRPDGSVASSADNLAVQFDPA